MKIKTEHVYPPIPLRMYDWSAIDDDTYDGQGSPMGWGASEQEAIEDLLCQIAERKADAESPEEEIVVIEEDDWTPPRSEDERPTE